MKPKLAPIYLLTAFMLPAAQIQAESLVDGSIEAGKAKAIACTACHGTEGNSTIPTWPNIAGQSADYIVAQLNAFKSSERTDPLMAPQAMMLSDEDMRNVAVYFESLPAAAMAVANPATVNKGEALYRGGDADSGIPACLACHGPSGRGNPAANYPALQGQHATYTVKQLRDYASGGRTSDGKTRIMRDISSRLSADDIEALASYVQGLQ
ncbi:MAG: c-type cytochrome [Desulfobulbaceae bacterium]|nr:c-type cytochrome [Desulfobulbaceae bacterium]